MVGEVSMMQQQPQTIREKSLGELFTELATETSMLVRQEVALAKAEATAKATAVGKDVGFLAAGAAVGYISVLAIVAGVIMLLANVMPAWLSSLLVGAAIGGAAYFLIMSAISRLRRMDPLPQQTIETLKEDAKWLKKEIS